MYRGLNSFPLSLQKHALAEKAHRRRLLASLTTIKALSKSVDQTLTSRERTIAALKLAKDQSKGNSMAGKKLGKHVVKTGEVDVQLGEELSESLRGLKVRVFMAVF